MKAITNNFDKDSDEQDVLVLINRSKELQQIKLDLNADILEEIPLKYIPKKYGEIIDKEDDGVFNKGRFNIGINEKSFRLFTLKTNNIE